MPEQFGLFDQPKVRRSEKKFLIKPTKIYTVALTQEERAWEEHLAQLQHKHWPGRKTMETSLEMQMWAHRIGARAEISVAKFYDLLLTDYLGRYKCPDFGPRQGPGIYVHGTNKEFYPRLPVRDYENSDSVFVLFCEFHPGLGRIHAWCWGRDAKANVPLTNPKPFGEVQSVPAHMVGMHEPFVNILDVRGDPIPEAILACCPRGYRPWSFR